MRRTGFEYVVKAEVEIPESDVDFLIDLSKGHYDLACRSLGVPGHGAVLNGMKNSAVDGVCRWPLGSRDVNLIMKVLELPHDRKDLKDSFRSLFGEIEAEWRRLNPEPSPSPA